jgi:hypothetical protein
MISNSSTNNKIKLTVISIIIKNKIKNINTIFVKSHCNLNTFKTKFSNLNFEKHDNLNIEEYHNSWKCLTRIIMKKSLLTQVERLLYLLHRYKLIIELGNNKQEYEPKKYSKIFNTLFTIVFFSKIVCENNVKYKDQIIKKSTDIVDTFIHIIDSNFSLSPKLTPYILAKNINQYNILFEKWQECDKEYMVLTMAKQYLLNEIKMSKPLSNIEEHQQIYYQSFKREQLSIKQDIKYVANNDWIIKFNDLISDKSNYDNIVKNIYWLDIDYNLYKTPHNKDTILNLFKETKRLMKNLIPNRNDLLEEIDNVIDEDIIKVVLNEDEVDEQFYYKKCYYILEKLKELQSPSMDNPLEKFKKEFVNKLSQQEYFRDLIPFFFRYVLDSLEKIHEEKDAFIEFIKNQNKN